MGLGPAVPAPAPTPSPAREQRSLFPRPLEQRPQSSAAQRGAALPRLIPMGPVLPATLWGPACDSGFLEAAQGWRGAEDSLLPCPDCPRVVHHHPHGHTQWGSPAYQLCPHGPPYPPNRRSPASWCWDSSPSSLPLWSGSAKANAFSPSCPSRVSHSVSSGLHFPLARCPGSHLRKSPCRTQGAPGRACDSPQGPHCPVQMAQVCQASSE